MHSPSPITFTLRSTALALLWLVAMPASAAPWQIWVGTQAGTPAAAKGIYHTTFDPKSGTLATPTLAAVSSGPGFLALHPSKPVLLAVGAPQTQFPDGSSALSAFAIEEAGSLRLLSETSTGGKGACHLAIDPTARSVAVAHYSDGSVSTLPLDATGLPGPSRVVRRLTGRGPHPRQDAAHAHGVYFSRDASRLWVPDLGSDQVLGFAYDAGAAQLGKSLDPLRTAPGAGPRHLVFSSDERHAYVINELDATLLAASRRGDAWSTIGTYRTLPENFSQPNTSAEIALSPDERFVYASNRGHDHIAVFSRDPATGSLKLIQQAPCGGATPRHFTLTPCGRWFLCGHLGSNTISVLPRDPTSGRLEAPSLTVPCPAPICILVQY